MPKKAASLHVVRFSVRPLGHPRTERQIRREVEAAFQEALTATRESLAIGRLKGTVEPEGGFLGGLELWLLTLAKPGVVAVGKAVGLGAAGAFGKKAMDGIWDRFAKRLRARNILVRKSTTRRRRTGKTLARRR
jgi:hypothetical protein